MTGDIRIEIAHSLTVDERRQIEALLPQMSSTIAFDPDRLQAMLDVPGVELFLALDEKEVVGMATLATFPLVTGWRGIVEDVVVDHERRGRGVARRLLEAIIDESARLRLRTLDLTSRPSRASAIRLYESLGFERRETNAMRFVPRQA